MFNNKNILITGGTGFFGKNFADYVQKKLKPKKIIIFSRDEAKQYVMKNEFDRLKYENIKFFLGDVRDLDRLKMAFRDVDYIVHAAALKHVPATEYNPQECVKTNIYGAQNIIEAAIYCNVKRIIALSTDKAVNPVNIYGASKLASDKLFIAANNLVGSQPTRFSVVRYGNVLESRGSVIPFFKELKEKKSKYFPVTHPNMTRFFIKIDQGIDFVLQSFKNMNGGEIFVPKLPSIKIVDIAKAIDSKIPIKFVGIRPGEKIHESLCPSDMAHLTLEFSKYFVIHNSLNLLSDKIKLNKNSLGEKGAQVNENFEYKSNLNHNFLNITQIKKLI